MPNHNPHRRTARNRQLRLERCEDRALLAGDVMLGGTLQLAPITELSLVNDSGYIAQDWTTLITSGGNFYQLDATSAATKTTTTFDYNLSGAGRANFDSINVNSSSGVLTTDRNYGDGYNGAADTGSDLEFGPGAADNDDPGVLITPQIPVIPTAEEAAIKPHSPALPTETISLASVLRNEPQLARDTIVRVASEAAAPSVATEKPAFLRTERDAAVSPEAIETLDRAFALEGVELEATSAIQRAVKSNGEAHDAAQTRQPPRGSADRDWVRSPAVTQTSFKIPVLELPAVASADEQPQATDDVLAESIPETWPAYLMSKARQTGLALTLGTVAIAIRLRWQRAEEELPQRSIARKFPNA